MVGSKVQYPIYTPYGIDDARMLLAGLALAVYKSPCPINIPSSNPTKTG